MAPAPLWDNGSGFLLVPGAESASRETVRRRGSRVLGPHALPEGLGPRARSWRPGVSRSLTGRLRCGLGWARALAIAPPRVLPCSGAGGLHWRLGPGASRRSPGAGLGRVAALASAALAPQVAVAPSVGVSVPHTSLDWGARGLVGVGKGRGPGRHAGCCSPASPPAGALWVPGIRL